MNKIKYKSFAVIVFFFLLHELFYSCTPAGNNKYQDGNNNMFTIGWSSESITPERPVMLQGQFYARVSEGIMDSLKAMALALESKKEPKEFISKDNAQISDEETLRTMIKEIIAQ